MKQSGYINKVEQKYKAYYENLFTAKMMTAMQIGLDAAVIAANDVLHMGKGRVAEFTAAYGETVKEIIDMVNADSKDDADISYTKGKIDARLKQICGDKFDPWEVRYGEVR